MPSKAHRTLITNKKKKIFLDAMAEGHSVTHAATLCGYSRRYMYDIRDHNPGFAKEWDDAWEQGADVFREEVRERALKGTKEAIVFKGQVTGAVRRMSDLMLIFATKARAPEYKDNAKVEVNVGDRLNELADAISGKAEEPGVTENPEPE